MIKAHLHGGRVDIWSDTDRCGRRIGFTSVTYGPNHGFSPFDLFKYSVALWLYNRWPRRFRNPVLTVEQP